MHLDLEGSQPENPKCKHARNEQRWSGELRNHTTCAKFAVSRETQETSIKSTFGRVSRRKIVIYLKK